MKSEIFDVPRSQNKAFTHSRACGSVCGDFDGKMVKSGIDLTIFFYNFNTHFKKEYEIGKKENIRFADKLGGIKFVDA